jgi:hypothetical protein
VILSPHAPQVEKGQVYDKTDQQREEYALNFRKDLSHAPKVCYPLDESDGDDATVKDWER